MATKSSFFLAILLIANPFMLLVFQNCTPTNHDRAIASNDNSAIPAIEQEVVLSVNKNLKIK